MCFTQLRGHGWEGLPEAAFAIAGERGSIDILAWHAATRTLLVVEVKTVVPDLQAMVAAIDRKERLGARIAAERGWASGRVASMLVLPEGSTARHRVAAHQALFQARFPDRSVAVRRFINDPAAFARPIRGLWFLSRSHHPGSRQRVRVAKTERRARPATGPSTNPTERPPGAR